MASRACARLLKASARLSGRSAVWAQKDGASWLRSPSKSLIALLLGSKWERDQRNPKALAR